MGATVSPISYSMIQPLRSILLALMISIILGLLEFTTSIALEFPNSYASVFASISASISDDVYHIASVSANNIDSSHKGIPMNLPSTLFKKWIHSYEEDHDNLKIYRPADYEFPPARGRDGFELKEGASEGVFIGYPIAPMDGNLKLVGQWSLRSVSETGPIPIDIQLPNQSTYCLILNLQQNGSLEVQRN